MRLLLLLPLLMAVLTAHGQNCNPERYLTEVFEEVNVTTGIKFGEADPYGLISSQDLLLDLYMPAGDALEKRPLIIYAFGGGFLIGLRNQPPIPEFCERWARMGYVVAAIDYRIGFNTTSSGSAERAVYRGVQDVRAAMRFLGQFSAGYGIDTTNIFLTGSSAGCFSALHSTFMEDSDRPQSTYGILLEPSDMGCADCSGNNYLNNRELRPRGIINHWGAILDTSFINANEFDNVPVISFHGMDDLIVPYASGNPFSYPIFPVVQGSAPIHQRLNDLGVMNELHAWPGTGHEPWLTEPRWLDTVFTHAPPFLYEVMRPQTSAITGDQAVSLNDIRSYSLIGQPDSEFCWSVNGGTIIANNGNTVDVLWHSSGTWTVSVVEVSCIGVLGHEQTLEVEVSPPTAIRKPQRDNVIIFPNPTNGTLSVKGLPSDVTSFHITDLTGRTVAHWNIVEENLLDVSKLPQGTYTLHPGEMSPVLFIRQD